MGGHRVIQGCIYLYIYIYSERACYIHMDIESIPALWTHLILDYLLYNRPAGSKWPLAGA